MQALRHRPRYETASDLSAESQIAATLEQRWQVTLSKMPISYSLDYMGHDATNRLRCWVEVKSRPSMTWGQYPTIMLSLGKLLHAEALIRASGRNAYFVVRDSTGDIRSAPLSKVIGQPHLIEWGGRTTRTRDSADIEPIVSVPVEMFRRVNP